MIDQLVQESLDALSCKWRKLSTSAQECDEIRTEFFLDTFQTTEEFLRSCLETDAISKAYIPLIADIYAFVDAKADENDPQIQAAQILTERMLYRYVVSTGVAPQDASCVTVYLLKNKRQLTIDLSDVKIAFPIMVEALQI